MMAAPLVYRYHATEDGAPERIGWCPAHVNRHGMAMVPARIVSADYKPHDDPNRRPGISHEPKYRFEAGKPFQVVVEKLRAPRVRPQLAAVPPRASQ
jgi:hypothetical protein